MRSSTLAPFAAATATLLSSFSAHAATSLSVPGWLTNTPIPWGFTLFSGLILLMIHLRLPCR